MLLVTADWVMPVVWIPNFVSPLLGVPARVTRLASIVMFDELLTSMAWSEVPLTVKPRTVTQLRPEIENPWAPPLTVTPGAAVNTIGRDPVPELTTVTCSLYVPAATDTVVPAVARWAPALIVQNGTDAVPLPALLQLALA